MRPRRVVVEVDEGWVGDLSLKSFHLGSSQGCAGLRLINTRVL